MDRDILPGPEGMHHWLGIVGAIVAPVTVISGLAFYFGYVCTRSRLSYFGIDANALGFTSSDYVLSSVSVLYAPVLVIILVWLAVLWGGDYLRRLVADGRRPRLARNLTRATSALGAVLTVAGILGVLRPGWVGVTGGAVAAVALGLGPAIVVIGYWISLIARPRAVARAITTTERMSLVVGVLIVVLAVFWATNVFATWYGQSQAEATAADLWKKESVVVLDTTHRLYPPADTGRPDGQSDYVLESTLSDEQAPQPMYRYECFRTLLVRGDRWVLVPARWKPEHGYAVIITTDESTQISVRRFEGLPDDPVAGNWQGAWQCPEVSPPS